MNLSEQTKVNLAVPGLPRALPQPRRFIKSAARLSEEIVMMKDPITIERKTFLDLARAWMAYNAGGTEWANRTRQALNDSLANAITERPFISSPFDEESA